MTEKLLQIILALSPIVYMRSITQNAFDTMFFHLAAISLLIASLFDIPVREFGYKKEAAALFVVCLVNVLLHRFNMYVVNSCVNLFFGFIFVYVMVRHVQSLNKIRGAIMFAALVNVVVYIVQLMGYNPFTPLSHPGHLGAFLNNDCRFATYLSVIFPLCMASARFVLILFVLVSFIAKQQAIMIPAFAYLMMRVKEVNAKAFVFICAIFTAFVPGLSTQFSCSHVGVRVETWKNVINGFLNNPVLGYGFGVFPWGPDKVPANTDAVIYSSLLQFVCGLGVLSLIWLVWVVRRVFKYDGSFEAISVVCLGVLCLYEYPFEIVKLWPTLSAIIALFLIKMQLNKEAVHAG